MRQVFVVTNALAFFPVVTKKKSFFQHFNSDGRPENREEGGRLKTKLTSNVTKIDGSHESNFDAKILTQKFWRKTKKIVSMSLSLVRHSTCCWVLPILSVRPASPTRPTVETAFVRNRRRENGACASTLETDGVADATALHRNEAVFERRRLGRREKKWRGVKPDKEPTLKIDESNETATDATRRKAILSWS